MKNVTVVIPAYNEENYIEQAILSAVHQAEYVLVSDNCSTDKTVEICKRLVSEHKNIRLYEQKKNIGALENHNFLYGKVQTEYIVNMGGHDILEENYISELMQTLQNNPDCALAYPSFVNIDDDSQPIGRYDAEELCVGTSSDDAFTRVFTIIDKLSSCSIFFGLCRTKEFIESCDYTPISAVDHVILCDLASRGKFIQNKNTIFYRRYKTRINNHEEHLKRNLGENPAQDLITPMCKKQFAILDRVPSSDKIKKDYFIKRAKKSLQRRFAKKCTEVIEAKIENLVNLEEKFIIYGAGTICDMVLERLKNKIEFIVDKDIKKHNTLQNGIKVVGIDDIFESDLRIIITVVDDVVFDDLISIGIEYERLISLAIFAKEI